MNPRSPFFALLWATAVTAATVGGSVSGSGEIKSPAGATFLGGSASFAPVEKLSVTQDTKAQAGAKLLGGSASVKSGRMDAEASSKFANFLLGHANSSPEGVENPGYECCSVVNGVCCPNSPENQCGDTCSIAVCEAQGNYCGQPEPTPTPAPTQPAPAPTPAASPTAPTAPTYSPLVAPDGCYIPSPIQCEADECSAVETISEGGTHAQLAMDMTAGPYHCHFVAQYSITYPSAGQVSIQPVGPVSGQNAYCHFTAMAAEGSYSIAPDGEITISAAAGTMILLPAGCSSGKLLGLPKIAVIGIGAGALVFIIAAIVSCVFLCKRRPPAENAMTAPFANAQ